VNNLEDKDEEVLLQQAIMEYESAQMNDPESTVASPIEKDNQYKFMRELLKTRDSKKIGNVTSEELGKINLSLRGALEVSLLSGQLGLDTTRQYYQKKAEILAATSMSRKSTFLSLIFTQIKKTFTGSSSMTPEKRGLFGWSKPKGDTNGQQYG